MTISQEVTGERKISCRLSSRTSLARALSFCSASTLQRKIDVSRRYFMPSCVCFAAGGLFWQPAFGVRLHQGSRPECQEAMGHQSHQPSRFPLQKSERPLALLCIHRHQFCHWNSRLGNDDFFAKGRPLQQFGKVGFSFVDINFHIRQIWTKSWTKSTKFFLRVGSEQT